MDTKDPLRTPLETAGQVGVQDGTLATWRARRRYNLKYIKVGGRVMYRQSDIDNFLESRTVSGVDEPPSNLRARPHTPKNPRPKPSSRGRRKA